MTTLKTKFEEIFDVQAIGNSVNTRNMNELLKLATQEQLTYPDYDKEQVIVVAIDPQQDFMDNGALGVPGSHNDIENFARFIYNNMNGISSLAISIDTHIPQQIFHPCWWINKNGDNPAPFTIITAADIDNGTWEAAFYPKQSHEYVKKLQEKAKKDLCIWPYHCLQGTTGSAVENQFANMAYFYSVAKRSIVHRLVKGQDPLSEMYGIIKAEYDPKNRVNKAFLDTLEKYDKIIFGGEAKSHCVLESIRQILEHYENRTDITSKVYVLEDCMSDIPGFEKVSADTFQHFKDKYKINIVKSTDLKLV